MSPMWLKTTLLYDALLSAYPREFRQRFGHEMAETFAEQLYFETNQYGLRGFAHVWSSGIQELFSVAVPMQLRSSVVIAAAVSFLLSCVLFIAFFRTIPSACTK